MNRLKDCNDNMVLQNDVHDLNLPPISSQNDTCIYFTNTTSDCFQFKRTMTNSKTWPKNALAGAWVANVKILPLLTK